MHPCQCQKFSLLDLKWKCLIILAILLEKIRITRHKHVCKRHEKHAHEKVRNVRSTNLKLMLVWWRLSNSMHQKMLNVPPLPDFVCSFHARITQAWFLIKLHRNGHYTICALSTVNFWFNLILIWVMMWKFGARHLVKPFANVTDTTKFVSDVCIRSTM